MIGIDTNVLLRLFVEDNLDQARAAQRLIAAAPVNAVFVSQLVAAETYWVLRRKFGWKRRELTRFVMGLLDMPAIEPENRFDFEEAADRLFLGNVEFSDCLIEVANERAGVSEIYTFDRKASGRRFFKHLSSKV